MFGQSFGAWAIADPVKPALIDTTTRDSWDSTLAIEHERQIPVSRLNHLPGRLRLWSIRAKADADTRDAIFRVDHDLFQYSTSTESTENPRFFYLLLRSVIVTIRLNASTETVQ